MRSRVEHRRRANVARGTELIARGGGFHSKSEWGALRGAML